MKKEHKAELKRLQRDRRMAETSLMKFSKEQKRQYVKMERSFLKLTGRIDRRIAILEGRLS